MAEPVKAPRAGAAKGGCGAASLPARTGSAPGESCRCGERHAAI